eukprot:scaffold18244_cov70-Cyclotella_meneghiniana.AAC.6
MPNDSVPVHATCEDDNRLIIEEYVMSEFLLMFGMDTKQSKLVSHEAVHSQTEPNSPRNEASHSPITDETPNVVWERLMEA